MHGVKQAVRLRAQDYQSALGKQFFCSRDASLVDAGFLGVIAESGSLFSLY